MTQAGRPVITMKKENVILYMGKRRQRSEKSSQRLSRKEALRRTMKPMI